MTRKRRKEKNRIDHEKNEEEKKVSPKHSSSKGSSRICFLMLWSAACLAGIMQQPDPEFIRELNEPALIHNGRNDF